MTCFFYYPLEVHWHWDFFTIQSQNISAAAAAHEIAQKHSAELLTVEQQIEEQLKCQQAVEWSMIQHDKTIVLFAALHTILYALEDF